LSADEEIFEDILTFAGRHWFVTNQTTNRCFHGAINFQLKNLVIGGTAGALKHQGLGHSELATQL
jgi:hypothetical protein